MRRSDRQFDPFTESVIDGMVAASVRVKVCRVIPSQNNLIVKYQNS